MALPLKSENHDELRVTPFNNERGEPCHRGQWSSPEDTLLRSLVTQCEAKSSWTVVASKIPGRSGKQCRERWLNHLDPNVVKGGWTLEEDERLIELHKRHGNSWSIIAKQYKGRTDNSIKNRWNSSLKKRAENIEYSQGSMPSGAPVHSTTKNSSVVTGVTKSSLISGVSRKAMPGKTKAPPSKRVKQTASSVAVGISCPNVSDQQLLGSAFEAEEEFFVAKNRDMIDELEKVISAEANYEPDFNWELSSGSKFSRRSSGRSRKDEDIVPSPSMVFSTATDTTDMSNPVGDLSSSTAVTTSNYSHEFVYSVDDPTCNEDIFGSLLVPSVSNISPF